MTLLAALLHEREREITDTLVELLISTVHRIGARAEKKVTEQLINAFKKVSGKENILFKLAEASLGTPEGTVRQVVFPAVSGGESTLRELATSARASKSLAIHSQLINCTASEVAAMIEGAMRHGTTMDVEANHTDSHGQSEIGFGITRLLNFDLLTRIKRINKVKLYRPVAGEPDVYPQLTPALTRPIRWELIAQQYDQMIKYTTAIRTRTASTEAILRRFTRNASHPTCAAMLEVGRAQKTIFVARYLRLRDLQREIEEGLNVMESSNGANSVIAYGTGGEIASNRRDEQEMFVLCLRILRSALVYVNTLMLQDVLDEPARAGLLTPADRRGLTPLFWSHVRPYGEVNLDMDTRLNLAVAGVPSPRTPNGTDDRNATREKSAGQSDQ